MKALHIREYVCGSTIGDEEASIALMNALRAEFEALYEAKSIKGAAVHTVRNSEQMEEERIDAAPVLRVTEGRYPFVWTTVTFDPEALREERLREIEERYSCRLTNSAERKPLWQR
jgi:hypothetical protein